MITQEAVQEFKRLHETFSLIDDAVFVINMGYGKAKDGGKYRRIFYWFGRYSPSRDYENIDGLNFDIKLKMEYKIDVENGVLYCYYKDKKYKMLPSAHSFSRSKLYKETE
jgi:hypothetical protein